MKITVIYGEDTENSRRRLNAIIERVKERGWEIVRLNREERRIIDQLETQRLLGGECLYVMEGVDMLTEREWKWLEKYFESLEINLLIWQRGNLSVNLKKLLPKGAKYEKFEVPVKIFRTLESIWPGNGKNCLRQVEEIMEEENAEFVVAMMARHLRDLIIVKLDKEALSYPEWRREKLLRQAGKFKKKKLERLIGKLAKADAEAKTGGVEMRTQLDLIIIRELE